MIKKLFIGFNLILLSINAAIAATTLQGQVYSNRPVNNTIVVIYDANGQKLITKTDQMGFYSADISNLTAPLMIFSDNNSVNPILYYGDKVCANNCVSSMVNTLKYEQINVANINPFTDLIVSYTAAALGYIGPVQLITQGMTQSVPNDILVNVYHRFYQLFDNALFQAQIDANGFDPITANESNIDALLSVIIHNRGYNSNNGEISHTTLFNMRFEPINEQTPLNFIQALNEKKQNRQAEKRIFIIGDSTASNYDKKVYPRMGWGQVFSQFIKNDANIVVINGAQSGRSSRSFYNEGWYDLLEPMMQKGDYLIIAFGHNDEKCDGSKPGRGRVDVMNLCTYPNDANNKKQYPDGQAEMSFQASLERYLFLAKSKGVQPILMTPVTRFRNIKNKNAYENNDSAPVVSTHFTYNKKGFLYYGNYSDTVKYTAQINHIPLIDLEALSIDFANQHANDWQSYWLAVDANDGRYPYYKNQSSGTRDHPDVTHFQEKGALAIAELIARAITHNSMLNDIPIIESIRY